MYRTKRNFVSLFALAHDDRSGAPVRVNAPEVYCTWTFRLYTSDEESASCYLLQFIESVAFSCPGVSPNHAPCWRTVWQVVSRERNRSSYSVLAFIECLSFVAAARVPPVHRGKLASALGRRLADVPSSILSLTISPYTIPRLKTDTFLLTGLDLSTHTVGLLRVLSRRGADLCECAFEFVSRPSSAFQSANLHDLRTGAEQNETRLNAVVRVSHRGGVCVQ